MKKIFQISLFIFAILASYSSSSYAQCKGFAKKMCKVELTPYLHDGNYHAAILTEGEEAELYKTFYSQQEYRIAVCGSENLPNLEFEIVDANRKVLYDNKSNNYSAIWDFKLESSQQLKILIKVPVTSNGAEDILSGCVSIMFGFKDK